MTDMTQQAADPVSSGEGGLVRRHRLSTRIWHWVNVVDASSSC